MRNKLVLALAAAVLMAVPAYAAVQNVKVSGDIDSTYLNRQHFNLGIRSGTSPEGEKGLKNQSVFLTQARLRVDADLSDNVSTTVGLINERAWTSETAAGIAAQNTDVQLYLAYATFRELLYSPLTVTIGRQIFNYGNGLIIGDGGPNNLATGNLGIVAADLTKRTSYDGIKAVLDYKPLTIDLFYFKNQQDNVTGSLDAIKTNSDVYGANANYQLGDAYNTVVEAYIFARLNGKNSCINTDSEFCESETEPEDKSEQLYVPGLRVSTNPIKGLNTQVELAWQGGRRGRDDNEISVRRQAMAAQFMASYALPIAELQKYKPVASASFTHVSGDKDNTSISKKAYTGWDPFNEAQGSGTIYNSIFDLTNMNIASVGLQATPMQDVTAQFTWSGLWADKKLTPANALTFRQPDRTSTALAPAVNSSHKFMGSEYDLGVNYAYTEDVSFGLSLGWFVPGSLFTNANDSTASQAIAHVLVNF
ncbi:MAG: alginate export family protein [Candidatus Omnitrophica bacterium]|nr:alginate export family protein [Candidatus Omnitrophota bacterium]